MIDTKILARDAISLILVLALVASFWWQPVNSAAVDILLKVVGCFVLGFYYGKSELPNFGYKKEK